MCQCLCVCVRARARARPRITVFFSFFLGLLTLGPATQGRNAGNKNTVAVQVRALKRIMLTYADVCCRVLMAGAQHEYQEHSSSAGARAEAHDAAPLILN
jgi:hypothetical protein